MRTRVGRGSPRSDFSFARSARAREGSLDEQRGAGNGDNVLRVRGSGIAEINTSRP